MAICNRCRASSRRSRVEGAEPCNHGSAAFELEPRRYAAVPTAVLSPLLVRRRPQRAIEQTVPDANWIVKSELAGPERGPREAT